jgi:polyhydroxybutyrate depolymerase
VLLLLGVPPVVALGSAVRFYATNASNGSLVSAGIEREYLLHVPTSYDATRPTPLVISLHGAGMWPAAQRDVSLWNEVADEQGFIVVYPSGVSGRGPRTWRSEGPARGVDDVRFISDLIDTLSARYRIDPARIYANGLSNGGGMTFLLSCTMGGRIAAVGVVGPALFLRWHQCADQRPVPLLAFHGTADCAALYRGGASWVAPAILPNIPRWVAAWARRNHCAPTPADTSVASDVTRRVYSRCAGGADVAFYTIEGGGHTWPGGGPVPEWFVGRTTHSVSASRLMWEFFRNHPLWRR